MTFLLELTAMGRRWTIPVALAVIAAMDGSIAGAQTARQDSAGTAAPQRIIVTAGAKYRAGWLHRAILGGDYRPLWTAPIELDVLDLDATAGGLKPTQRGGSMQTNSLRFVGADGREYVFRPSEKDFSRGLPEELRETLVRDIAQDQTVGYHPAAALIVSRLLDATGIHHPRPRFVVMPDSPRLGEFRAEFACVVGTFEERPGTDFDETPESVGATTVISSERLFERMRRNHENVVDARAYLTARLFDVWVGDRDRHRDQWRWGRFSNRNDAPWEPIPRDRDMPFARFEGLGPWLVRGAVPQLVTFTSEYPDMVWLNWNAREIDRRLFVSLERAVWDSVALTLQSQMTDAVLDSALALMPAPYFELNGRQLRAALIARRERLPEAARKFYLVHAREVDFSATDDGDVAEVTRAADGSVLIALYDRKSTPAGRAPDDKPYLSRRFRPDETREVRVFLHGGDDRVIVRGARDDDILVRIIGGDGDDVVLDSVARGDDALRFYDAAGRDRIESAAAATIDRSPYTPPTTARVEHAVRDWGEWAYTARGVSVAPSVGLLASMTHTRLRYGFRNNPFASRSVVRLDLSFGEQRPRLTYAGTFRRQTSNRYADLRLMASGIELIRFHGIGNETESDRPADYYRVFQNLFRVEPGWVWRSGTTQWSLGALGQYTATRGSSRTLVGETRPYGSGEFGEVGATVGLMVDRRDSPIAPRKGFRLAADASFHPALWDVASTFAKAQVAAATYLSASTPLSPTLAIRVGGQHTWGTFPFHDAAFLGGRTTLRGWDEQRFAGRSSLYGSTELRIELGKVFIVVPADVGVLTFLDAGRVFADGSNSDEWHSGFGGGIWLAPLTRGNTVSLSVARGRERLGVYVASGFAF